MEALGFTSRAIHTRFVKKDAHGSLKMPVYENVSFEFDSAAAIADAFSGRSAVHVYSRITNPTVEHLENQLKNLTGALATLAVASGMAAISNLLLCILQSGDNLIASRHLFGNTYSFLEKTLRSWGVKVKYADLTHSHNLVDLIDDHTRAVFLETITNPQMQVADVAALSNIARPRGILLIADTTMTPPYLFQANQFGVDVEVLSSTKLISGGATSVGGIIIDYGSYDWRWNDKLRADAVKFGPFALMCRLRGEVYRNLGACLSPQNAFLQSLGLETLALRADKSTRNALQIANFLQRNPMVKHVNYPGLSGSPYHQICLRQFPRGAGSVLTFDLPDRESCFKFLDGLKLIRRTTNLHDNRTLVLHPASTIFSEFDDSTREELGVRDSLIRLAVGIEDYEDLISDISRSLEIL